MDHPRIRPAASERHRERVHDQLLAHVVGHAPADDPPGERVLDGREVQPPLPGPQIAEVSDPKDIRRVGAELALHEIISDPHAGHSYRGTPALARHKPRDAGVAHQPLNTLAANVDPVRDPQLRVDPRSAVHATVLRVDHLDLLDQERVRERPVRRRARRPVVVART